MKCTTFFVLAVLGDFSDFFPKDDKLHLFVIQYEIRAFSRKLTFFVKN